jgi:hypothetical protein
VSLTTEDNDGCRPIHIAKENSLSGYLAYLNMVTTWCSGRGAAAWRVCLKKMGGEGATKGYSNTNNRSHLRSQIHKNHDNIRE